MIAPPSALTGGTLAIPIAIVGQHVADSLALPNPYASPPEARQQVAGCADQLAIMCHSVEIVVCEPGLNPAGLLREIKSSGASTGLVPRTDKSAIALFHNLAFLSGLGAALVTLKSLLDLYARVIGSLLVPSATVFGFGVRVPVILAA